MSDAQDTIKEFVAAGKRFFIASDPSFNEATFFAAVALKKILEAAGKEVFFWPAISADTAARYAPLVTTDSVPVIPRKIKIRIPKSVALEEMRYDDEPDAISIVISPKTHLDIKDLLIERAPYDVDAAFCFFDDEATLEKIEAPIARPPREKTIYFTRQNFDLPAKILKEFAAGEQNLGGQVRTPPAGLGISSPSLLNNTRTLAEKVSDIGESIAGAAIADPAITTLLLASLLAETHHFHSTELAPTFRLAASLCEHGARIAEARAVLERPLPISEIQLFGRALARTTVETALATSWTFLAARDFEKTKTAPSPALLRMLIEKISDAAGRPPISILCYEGRDAPMIHTLVFGDTAPLRRLANRWGILNAEPPIAGPHFPTFSDAEIKIRQLLKEGGEAKIQG